MDLLQTKNTSRPNGLGINNYITNGNGSTVVSGSSRKTSGAFVILNNKDTTRQITNYADALWLPIRRGTVYMYKYKSQMNNGNEVSTTTKLSGAKFQLYDQNGNIVKLIDNGSTSSVGKYIYSETGTVTTITTTSNYIEFTELPYGKYYLYETQTPSQVGNYKYIESSSTSFGAPKESVVLNIPNSPDSSKEVITSTFTLSSSTQTASVYNKEVETDYGRIVGTKKAITVDKNGNKQIVPLKGAVIGMFPTEVDAQNETNMITSATSGSDGKYTISLKDIQNLITTPKTYYFKEISAPSGYQKVDVIKSKMIVTINSNTEWPVDTIYDVQLGTIRVWIDASDDIQNNFNVKLTGTYTANGNTVTKVYPVKKTINTDSTYHKNNSWLPAKGYCEFKVPLFYAYGTNDDQYYKPISYTVEETGYNNGIIPYRYMCQLYKDISSYTESTNSNVFENSVATDMSSSEKQPVTFSNTYLSWHGTNNEIEDDSLSNSNQFNLSTSNVEFKASIFNVSVKIKASSVAADTGMFLNSTFKTINYKKYPTTKVPTTTATFSPYNSIASTGNITEWTVGNLMESNGSEYQNGSYQWRTDFIDTEGAEMIKMNIEGDNYKYYVFWYDKNKNFLYVDKYREDNGSENINSTTTQSLSEDTAYIRIVRYKTDSSSTIHPFSLNIEKQKGSWVYFDNWFGTTDLRVEQTSVENGYYLVADNVRTETTLRNNAVTGMYGYVYNTKTDETTGKMYIETNIKFRNVKMANFVRVGGNGFIQYIYIGLGICVAALIPCAIYKKRKKKPSISKIA